MNSTTLLKYLEKHFEKQSVNLDVDITKVANDLDIPVSSLVSLLTELEHRDEIQLDISTTGDSIDYQQYFGTIRLMRTPPDEIQKVDAED